MSTGVGIDAVEVEGEWVGRSALDDRLLTRASYHNLGIVMGGVVATSPSAMSYSVGPGTDPVSVGVGSRSGADGASLFVIPHGTVATTAAPASGARIDVVWAKQNDPSKGDVDNQSVLGVTQGAASGSPVAPALPVGAVELASYRVPSGATRTSEATLTHTGDYAIPYGASLGMILNRVDKANGAQTGARSAKGTAVVTLPTPRLVRMTIAPTIAANSTSGSGVALYRFTVNGDEVFSAHYEFGGYYETGLIQHSLVLPAGDTAVQWTRELITGNQIYQRYGMHSGRMYSGTAYQLFDEGVASTPADA